jgi:hypothetical protein
MTQSGHARLSAKLADPPLNNLSSPKSSLTLIFATMFASFHSAVAL